MDLVATIKSQAGSEEEEITEAQIAAVLKEVLSGGTGKAAGGDPGATRKALLPSTTKALQVAARTVKFATHHDGSGDADGALREYDTALGLYAEALADQAKTLDFLGAPRGFAPWQRPRRSGGTRG